MDFSRSSALTSLMIPAQKPGVVRERRGASYDALLGRDAFVDELREMLTGSTSTPDASVVVVALDRWALLESAFEREEVETILAEFARRVVRHAAPWLVARTRRGELAILVEGECGGKVSDKLCARLLRVMRAPFRCGSRRLALSASAGIACSGESAAKWLQDADAALHRAQAEGGGHFKHFNSVERAQVLRRVELESELRHALRRGDLRVNYQPIVDPNDGRLVGLEALVRWKHARLGPIMPTEFVSLAEQSGLIHDLGRFVRGSVLSQLAQWKSAGGPLAGIRVSVNVSAVEFARPGLVEMITEEIRRHGVDASRLWLELTESQRLTDVDSVAVQSAALAKLGVGIVLDDFATGYSSLQLLAKLQVRAIKLERTFVAGLGVDPNCDAIVEAAFSLATVLGIGVIPEGIETPEQAEALCRLGCRSAQGFLWSPALAPAEIAEWAAQRAARGTAVGGRAVPEFAGEKAA